MKPVDDVHFSIPRESSEHDMVMPRDISEPSVTAPSSPNPEPIIHDANPALEPVRPDATEHYPPAIRSSPGPPRQEAGIRRSSRANKGKTTVFKDYLTGDVKGRL